jgi:hypothetical protein
VIFRNHQHAAGAGADAFERRLHRLHRERLEGRVEIVETAREQVGVHRRQLETGVAQVHGTIEGGGGLEPLGAEPALDAGLVLQQVGLDFQQRPGQGRGEVRDVRPSFVTHGSLAHPLE